MVIELTLETWWQIETISAIFPDAQLGLRIAAGLMLIAHDMFLLSGLLSMLQPYLSPAEVLTARAHAPT